MRGYDPLKMEQNDDNPSGKHCKSGNNNYLQNIMGMQNAI